MNNKTSTADKNLYNTWVDSQKKMIDTLTESTQKLANNELVGETLEKGSEIYKNWLDSQLTFINKQTAKLQDSPGATLAPENVAETAKNWMQNQMQVTKDFMDFSMNTMKEYVESVNKANPSLNGSGEKMTQVFNQNMDTYKKWNDTLAKNYEQLIASFDNKTVKDTMKGMFIQADVYNKFIELWTPVIKAIQNNTFTPETLSNFINPVEFKKFMDKLLGWNKELTDNFTSAFTASPMNEWMNQVNEMNKNLANMMSYANNPSNDMMKNWMNMFNMQSNPMMNSDMIKNWMNMFNMQSNPVMNSDMMKNWMNMFNMQGNPVMNSDMMKNWMNMFTQNPMMNSDAMKNWMNMFNTFSQWNEMTKNFQSMFNMGSNPLMNNDWMKNWMNMFGNTAQWTDMTKNWQNMFNMLNNPMMNNDVMKNWQNMFNMSNNPVQNDMMKNWMNMFNMQNNPMADVMKKMNEMTGASFNPLMTMFQNADFFGNMMSAYNNMYSSAEHIFGPMFRMMTPGAAKDNIELMTSVYNKWNQYNIKNAEMQYLTYTAGVKAMKKIAERIQEKMAKGEEYKGMNALYTEWLNTSDKTFVELFEGDEFSKVQAEVASLSHTLKKEVETLMEKMMANVPVITRTEMDDTYKTIYDINKRVKDLERSEKSAQAETKTVTAAQPASHSKHTTTSKSNTKSGKKK